MSSILSKSKKLKKLFGLAWSIGNWETIALAYRGELDLKLILTLR
jgi:hypothetical protein